MLGSSSDKHRDVSARTQFSDSSSSPPQHLPQQQRARVDSPVVSGKPKQAHQELRLALCPIYIKWCPNREEVESEWDPSPNLSVGYASRCFLAAAAHLHKDSLVAPRGGQTAGGARAREAVIEDCDVQWHGKAGADSWET